jgi:hypothetical protein
MRYMHAMLCDTALGYVVHEGPRRRPKELYCFGD